uniref:Uncharacterized protein n=1 Tax=Arundo donax TaxID=35708 RepID=A0A0A9U4V1_ARUDO
MHRTCIMFKFSCSSDLISKSMPRNLNILWRPVANPVLRNASKLGYGGHSLLYEAWVQIHELRGLSAVAWQQNWRHHIGIGITVVSWFIATYLGFPPCNTSSSILCFFFSRKQQQHTLTDEPAHKIVTWT